MNDNRRALALYGWPEVFVGKRHNSLICSLIEISAIDPNKISFFLPGSYESRQRTVSRTKSVARILEDFGTFEGIVAEHILENDFRTSQNSLTLDLALQEFIVENEVSAFSEKEIAIALKSIFSFFTPRYGFSDIFEGITAKFLPTGTGSNRMSRLDNQRAADFFDDRRGAHDHLNGKMLDVYAINILSDAHMNRPVGNKSLKDWIDEAGYGEIINAKPGVTIWALDEKTKAHVRRELFDRGCLIVSV